MWRSHQPDIVMTAPVSIRPLLPSDAQAFRELRLEALSNHPEAFSSSYEEELPSSLEEFQARIPVVLTNESARRTYHGLGFRPYGIEPKAIRVGDTFYDEELLYLDLPQPTGP